jgi:hypothetical protein
MRSEGRGMRCVILLLATMCLTLLSVGGVVQAHHASGEVVDASCPINNETGYSFLLLRNNWIMAQTFTAQHTGPLTSAQVLIYNMGNENTSTTGTNSMVMEIRAVDSSGTPTGVVLASTTIPPSDIPPVQSRVVTGHFSPGAPVEAGKQYAIALHTPNEPDSRMAWQGNQHNPCPGESYETRTIAPVEFGVPDMNVDHFFSTFVTLPDTTPPKVTSTAPKSNAVEVAPTANLRATFSEEMDSNTIDGTTFQLFKKGTTTQIPATVSYNADTNTAKLDPIDNLRRGVAYKAVVSTWAKDVAGNRLDQDGSTSGLQQKRWFFRVDD